MHRLARSVFILCLLISCWFREGKSENVQVAEVRQENSPQESVYKTSENEARAERTSKPSSYSGGSALSRTGSYSSRSDAQSAGIEAGIGENCHDDIVCLSMASNDRIGLEAIRALHRQLDDDANGNVDLSESDEFLREELKYEQGYERRQRAFHFNDDMHISVRELWEAWIRSEVSRYNSLLTSCQHAHLRTGAVGGMDPF
uniref:STIM1/2 EF-hand domain-containing protein n=1 Tax=Timema cristinae TaxID=61476 RepID=A0A7R9HC01_TIMCR|nr:unnamed protein product [Timema cristinae]